jgi:NAD(P)-binding Rossmann-like domain
MMRGVSALLRLLACLCLLRVAKGWIIGTKQHLACSGRLEKSPSSSPCANSYNRYAHPPLRQSRRYTLQSTSLLSSISDDAIDSTVDYAIIGAGLGGLCAGATLNTIYKRKVAVFEAHVHPGGCAHSYPRQIRVDNTTKFTCFMDSGPTILLGCSRPPYNALQQVLTAIGQPVKWIPYDGW